MLKNPRLWLAVIAFLAVGVLIKVIFPFSVEAVKASVSIAPEVIFEIGGFPVSNSLLTAAIVFVIITLFSVLSTRNMQLVPSGLQNVMETLIEAIIGIFESIAGPAWPKFFTIAASIFILLIFSNFMGLLPGFGSFGVIRVDDAHPAPQGVILLGDAPDFIETYSLAEKAAEHAPAPTTEEHAPEGAAGEAAGEFHQVLAPIFRAPSSDINLPLALALASVFMTQVYGMRAQGMRYWTRFFSFGRLLKGDIAFGLIDVFVGIVELISELGKIIAFTFRLFGNIFAGEVILLIMSFLFLFLPFPFYGLEVFVAVIQAFVFAVLTVAFMRIATAEHGSEEHH